MLPSKVAVLGIPSRSPTYSLAPIAVAAAGTVADTDAAAAAGTVAAELTAGSPHATSIAAIATVAQLVEQRFRKP